MDGMEMGMSSTEKITINLGPVDLGRIDLLVEQGVYSNRTDLIRTAIRNQLDRHTSLIDNVVVSKEYALGVYSLTKQGLEKRRAAGERVRLRVIGMVSIATDIEPDLARETIDSIVVFGVLRASRVIEEALSDRINRSLAEE
jgi:Arc/MetJ-type ribon-helix-helix transcriptional regulator